jgi:hypothetical protein
MESPTSAKAEASSAVSAIQIVEKEFSIPSATQRNVLCLRLNQSIKAGSDNFLSRI